MNSSLRAFAALLLVLASLSGCNCGPNKCNASNCSTGCCDSSGVCQGGFLPERCGSGGAACTTCSVGQSCTAGQCGLVSVGGGGGGSGSTGGGGGGIGTGGGGGGNPNTFCATYASAYCDYGIRCGQFASQARADCITFIEQVACEPELAGVKKGFDIFNGATAQACADSFNTLACGNNDPSGTGACSQPLVSPASSTGQGCFGSQDCEVATDACGGAGCNRTCTMAGGLGQPCPRASSCNSGLRCDVLSNLCSNPHNLGDTCVPYNTNECTADGRCDSTSSTCVALPVSGPCYNGYTCAPTAFCDFGTTTCHLKVSDGQACTFGGCVDGFWCDLTSTNTCKGQTGAGTSCVDGYGSCQSGLGCKNNTCQPLSMLNGACAYYSDCATSLECDPVTKTCVNFEGEMPGQACTDYHYCNYPDVCRGLMQNPDGGVGTPGICAPPMLGDTCSSQSFGECPAQSFCNGTDGGMGNCTASTHSSPYFNDQDCLAGDFCGGTNCQPKLQMGQACNPNSTACVAPLQCVTNATDGGTCGNLGGLNAPCAGGNSCLFPFTCVGGTCVASGKQGQPCFDGFICLVGLCQSDAGVTGTCSGQLAADGDACFFATQCQSGSCLGSTCAPSCP